MHFRKYYKHCTYIYYLVFTEGKFLLFILYKKIIYKM
jgi:hypothetical protein